MLSCIEMNLMRWHFKLLFATLLLCASSSAQQQTPDWQTRAGSHLSFEVASIRPNPGPFISPNVAMNPFDEALVTGGIFSADFPAAVYIRFAYKVPYGPHYITYEQLPKWTFDDYYDIHARANGDPTKDQYRLMMQSLLAERFHLAIHFEKRKVPVLALRLIRPGKLGPKLIPHSLGPHCNKIDQPDIFPSSNKGMTGHASSDKQVEQGSRDISIPEMAAGLVVWGNLDKPVVDQTGLAGTYDYVLKWVPDPSSQTVTDLEIPALQPDSTGSSFLQALREQLGMKLVPTEAEIPVLVVDHIDRPSEN